MCPFWVQRSFCSRTMAAYVFCALIFLSSQPSDGAFDGEWGTFFDHYGRNLESLEDSSGDVLEKDNGELLVIWDKKVYFQMNPLLPQDGLHEMLCDFYKYPQPGHHMLRMMKKIGEVPNREVTFALASMMAGKFLPFHAVHCNKLNYMNYILYAQIHYTEQFKECPLNGSWRRFKPSEIRDKTFKLTDSYGKQHDFDEYESGHGYTKAEIADRVAGYMSPRPGKKGESMKKRPQTAGYGSDRPGSWHKRLYSFGRQVSRSFRSQPKITPAHFSD